MRAEKIRPIIGKLISESYKGTCEDIAELEEEEIHSSMYNSGVMNSRLEGSKERIAIIEEVYKGDSPIKKGRGDQAVVKEDAGSRHETPVKIFKIDEFDKIISTPQEKPRKSNTQVNEGIADDLPDLHTDSQFRLPSGRLLDFRRQSKFTSNNDNCDTDRQAQEIFDRAKDSKGSHQSSIKKLQNTILGRPRPRHDSFNASKLSKTHLNFSNQSFAKKKTRAVYKMEDRKNITQLTLKSCSIIRRSDKKPSNPPKGAKSKPQVRDSGQLRFLRASGSTRSLDFLDKPNLID